MDSERDTERDPEHSAPNDELDRWALEHPEEAPTLPGVHTALPPKLEAWRRRSAAGAILTGFALGLQEALEKRKEDPSIVMETSGEPPADLPVEADFEYGRPRQSVVQIRPWLLPDQATDASDAARTPASPAAAAPEATDESDPAHPNGEAQP